MTKKKTKLEPINVGKLTTADGTDGKTYTIDYKENKGFVQVVVGIWLSEDRSIYYVGVGRAKWNNKTKKWKHTKSKSYPCPLPDDFPQKYEKHVRRIANFIEQSTGKEIKLFKSGIETLEDILNFRS